MIPSLHSPRPQLLNLLPDLPQRGLRRHRHREHPKGRQDLHFGHVVLERPGGYGTLNTAVNI